MGGVHFSGVSSVDSKRRQNVREEIPRMSMAMPAQHQMIGRRAIAAAMRKRMLQTVTRTEMRRWRGVSVLAMRLVKPGKHFFTQSSSR